MKFLLLCCLAMTCAPDPIEVVPFNQEFDIHVGERAIVEGYPLVITFIRVADDSRCPEGARCIWQGNGRVTLRIEKTGVASTQTDLNTTLDPRSVSYAGFVIELKRLSPYPKIGESIDP